MTCRDCTNATAKRWHGFSAECKGCCARATARGINYRESRQQGTQTPRYRAELTQMGLTHQQVRAAAQSDAMSRSN